jgi:FlaA1/EpsC-like NDP-sugar epimerase
VTRFEGEYSRSAFIIFGLLVFVTQLGSRLSFRLFDHILIPSGPNNGASNLKPILIYGAGKAGKLLCEEVLYNPSLKEYAVVGFMDDNPNRVGRKLCCFDVRDSSEWIEKTWERLPEVWVSSRSIGDKRVGALLKEWKVPIIVKRMQLTVEPISFVCEPEVGSLQLATQGNEAGFRAAQGF